MIEVRERDLDVIETPGGNFGAAIATPSRGATEVSVIRQRQLPGGANPLHRHDREEVLVMLSGSATVTCESRRSEVNSGDAIIIPAGALHKIEASGADPAEWLLVAPTGVRFLHANGDEGSPPWAK
jgi:quercetin dioxygenase-like cupin family protein